MICVWYKALHHLKVLRDAGAADADLMVAVTASDEINMVACQMGYTLFNTPTRIARIRNSEYLREKTSCSTMKIYLLII